MIRARRAIGDIWVLAGFLLACAVVAGVSGAITVQNIPVWYAGVNKPSFNPPNWLFGPVWTALYIMMAIAAWRVWRSGRRSPAFQVYAAQLTLNFLWSPLFFGLHRVGFALIDITALAAVVALTTLLFWRRDRLAGALMVPYLAWVLFAAALNLAIWCLN